MPVTILPNSNAPIITMVPMIAPEKIVAIPITEKYVSIPAMVILVTMQDNSEIS